MNRRRRKEPADILLVLLLVLDLVRFSRTKDDNEDETDARVYLAASDQPDKSR